MVVLILLSVFGAIIALEVPGLVRKRMWGELAAFAVLLAVGMVFSVAQVLNLPLPNPTRFIDALFEPVAGVINRILMTRPSSF